MIVSVGPRGLLARCLPRLAEALHDPVVTLEAIAQVKHDGRLLEPPPVVATRGRGEPDLWQTIRVYTRRSAQVDGRALYSELTRRLREAGAAGATTVFGDWGFSSDEPAHGDRLGRIGSQRPSYTVYVDRPERVAEIWPVIDEVTAEHGVVTSVLVPGYRERIGEITHGSLDVAERAAWVTTLAQRRPPERRAARGRWSP
jgi:PII-like signaling protein